MPGSDDLIPAPPQKADPTFSSAPGFGIVHSGGSCSPPSMCVLLSRFDVVEPDLLYVSNERAPDLLSGQYVTGAPDLAIEIGSPGTRRRDETIKRRLYERSNVTE